jgi:hypothetical protein
MMPIRNPDLKLGGTLRTNEGLRFVPLGAAALGYDFAVLQISGHLDDEVVQEFRNKTPGLTIVLRASRVNPAATWGEAQTAARAEFRQQVKLAEQLRARAIILPAGLWDGVLLKNADAAEARMLSFFADVGSDTMPLWIDPPNQKYGRRNALAVCKANKDFSDRSIGLLIGMCDFKNLWWAADEAEELLNGDFVAAIRYQSPKSWSVTQTATYRHTRTLFQRLAEFPLVVDHPSLAVQAEISEGLRKNLGMDEEEGV